jgi:hypothetical protein
VRKRKGNTVDEEMENGDEKKVGHEDEKATRREVKRGRTQDRDVAMYTFTWLLAKT